MALNYSDEFDLDVRLMNAADQGTGGGQPASPDPEQDERFISLSCAPQARCVTDATCDFTDCNQHTCAGTCNQATCVNTQCAQNTCVNTQCNQNTCVNTLCNQNTCVNTQCAQHTCVNTQCNQNTCVNTQCNQHTCVNTQCNQQTCATCAQITCGGPNPLCH